MPYNPTRRYVVMHQGDWAVKRANTYHPESLHATQTEAIATAKKIIRKAGGGGSYMVQDSKSFKISEPVMIASPRNL